MQDCKSLYVLSEPKKEVLDLWKYMGFVELQATVIILKLC